MKTQRLQDKLQVTKPTFYFTTLPKVKGMLMNSIFNEVGKYTQSETLLSLKSVLRHNGFTNSHILTSSQNIFINRKIIDLYYYGYDVNFGQWGFFIYHKVKWLYLEYYDIAISVENIKDGYKIAQMRNQSAKLIAEIRIAYSLYCLDTQKELAKNAIIAEKKDRNVRA